MLQKENEPSMGFTRQADLRCSLKSSKSLVTKRHPPHISVSGIPADKHAFFKKFSAISDELEILES